MVSSEILPAHEPGRPDDVASVPDDVTSVPDDVTSVIETTIGALVHLCLAVACLVAMFIALFGTVDVVSTYLFGRPVPLARELPKELLVLVIFMAMPTAMRNDRNVAVDLFIEFTSSAVRTASRVFVLTLCGALFGFLTWQSWFAALDSWSVHETVPAAVRIPIYPIKTLMCVALAVTTIECMRLLVATVLPRAVPVVQPDGEG